MQSTSQTFFFLTFTFFYSPYHLAIMSENDAEPTDPSPPTNDVTNGVLKSTRPVDSTGWDGKARVERRAVLSNPEALSDPEYSDEDAPPVDQIEADEGTIVSAIMFPVSANPRYTDLLEDYEGDTDVCSSGFQTSPLGLY